MPLFKAEVYTLTGEKKQLRKEAPSENDLLRELGEAKYVIISVKEEKPRTWSFSGKTRKKTLRSKNSTCSARRSHPSCAAGSP